MIPAGWYRTTAGLACWLTIAIQIGAGATFTPIPQYDLDIHLDVTGHQANVTERVTWFNVHDRPTSELVFNAHSHFKLADKDVGLTAKMLEILRMNPSEALDFDGHACEVKKVTFFEGIASKGQPFPNKEQFPFFEDVGQKPLHAELPFYFRAENETALVVPLPREIRRGDAISIEIQFVMHLPQKQGRWGQWKGVTFLSNWLPVLAFYDEHGWQPTPFIPWHQPFFNEAGSFNARVTVPSDQKVASTGSIISTKSLPDNQQQIDISVSRARDFALLCSARFTEFTGQAGTTKVRCLAFPEHAHYAQIMVRVACEAIPVYNSWFGPYPYSEFTIVESYFGWNGNECAGLVMIDERVFDLPHIAENFVEYLVSHETCHQWWYNVVGTNGYAETWMDEGLATYFSHRLMNIKHGKNNAMLNYPHGLEWLPNIGRETYRFYGLYGTLGRGDAGPTVQEMPRYEHLVNLLSMCYDRGSKIVGMIEDRLGEAAFFDFLHLVYSHYYFGILRVADFQRELEAYTGKSWEDFFKHWLYGADMTDWSVEHVQIDISPAGRNHAEDHPLTTKSCDKPCKVTVILHQKGDYSEQTVVGFRLSGANTYQFRVPIVPEAPNLTLEDPPARVKKLPDNRWRVDIVLPSNPLQIAVDPDQVLMDRDPANNFWKPEIRFRMTPLFTQIDETDLTTAYDRWNITAGPWIYGAAYDDPWYTRSPMAGLRLGLYRTQEFNGGVYAAYRTDDRDFVAGVDGLWDHWPWVHTQVGFNAERGLTSQDTNHPSDRAVLFGRYVFKYGDSLYLPPMQYVEGFGAFQENNLQLPRHTVPGAERFDQTTTAGIHYHMDYLTPYWDPEGGFRLDTTYANGVAVFGQHDSFNLLDAQLSVVKILPGWLGPLAATRVAARIYGAAGLPSQGEYFPLGGGSLFRGFDQAERQGSAVWVGSIEWRVPLARGLTWDCCDHIAGLRNIYTAIFYDVGDAYLRGHALGNIEQAVGAGLRLDVAWFSFVERTILRLDVAKTVDGSAPLQIWAGLQHPF